MSLPTRSAREVVPGPAFAWGACVLALGVVALRLFDMLLRKGLMEQPVWVGGWLATALALFLGARAAAVAWDARGALPRAARWSAKIGRTELIFVVMFLLLIGLFHWGYMRAASDGREYFVQVRSLLIDGDLDFANEASFGVRGTSGIYPVGGPILWIPWFLAAHLWLGLLNLTGADYVRDGFINPYQRAVGLGTLVYGFAGLVLSYRLARDIVTPRIALLSTSLTTFGTFVVWYLVVDNSMVHGMSLFSVALFLTLWLRTRSDGFGGADSRTPLQWGLLGAAVGLMALVRWQNLLFGVIFVGVDVAGQFLRSGVGAPYRQRLGRQAICAVAALVVFFPQLVFWRVVRGGWLAVPSGAHGVDATRPPVLDVLFSPDRGLFAWTPLVSLAVIGLGILAAAPPSRRVEHRALACLLIAALAAQVYVNSLVAWGGHGFGARRFANCTVIFVIGLAALLDWLRRHPLVAPTIGLGALVALNASFVLDLRTQRLPMSGAIPMADVVANSLRRTGNPFSLPMSLWVAWQYGGDLTLYERLGSQTFNNLRLQLGAPDAARYLVHGWGGVERNVDGPYRWSVGPESSLVAPLRGPARYVMELHIAPFRFEGADRQRVDILFNGEQVDQVALQQRLRSYRVVIPATEVRAGRNELRFRYARTTSPRELGLSEDGRRLAVRFVAINLLRQ